MFIKPEKWVIIYRLLYTLAPSEYIGHLFLLAYVTLYSNDCQFFTVWTFYNLCCQSFTEAVFSITWNIGTHISECLYWDICRLNKICTLNQVCTLSSDIIMKLPSWRIIGICIFTNNAECNFHAIHLSISTEYHQSLPSLPIQQLKDNL